MATPPAPVHEDIEVAPRRSLLPDIEEINSSLRHKGVKRSDPPRADDARVELDQRRSFRTGFGLVMLVTAALLMLYSRADWVVESFPGLDGAMRGYVSAVNDMRLWLDDKAAALLVRLNDDGTGG